MDYELMSPDLQHTIATSFEARPERGKKFI